VLALSIIPIHPKKIGIQFLVFLLICFPFSRFNAYVVIWSAPQGLGLQMFLECVYDVFMDLEGEVISNDALQVVEGYKLARQFQKIPVVPA
jgi:hypothetical protein